MKIIFNCKIHSGILLLISLLVSFSAYAADPVILINAPTTPSVSVRSDGKSIIYAPNSSVVGMSGFKFTPNQEVQLREADSNFFKNYVTNADLSIPMLQNKIDANKRNILANQKILADFLGNAQRNILSYEAWSLQVSKVSNDFYTRSYGGEKQTVDAFLTTNFSDLTEKIRYYHQVIKGMDFKTLIQEGAYRPEIMQSIGIDFVASTFLRAPTNLILNYLDAKKSMDCLDGSGNDCSEYSPVLDENGMSSLGFKDHFSQILFGEVDAEGNALAYKPETLALDLAVYIPIGSIAPEVKVGTKVLEEMAIYNSNFAMQLEKGLVTGLETLEKEVPSLGFNVEVANKVFPNAQNTSGAIEAGIAEYTAEFNKGVDLIKGMEEVNPGTIANMLSEENSGIVIIAANSAGDAIKAMGPRKFGEVLKLPVGLRPNPETYLPKEYIASHLGKFDEGASFLIPKNNLDKYGRDFIGFLDNTQFVMPKSALDDIIKKTGGDVAAIEKELGIPTGKWKGQEMSRIDIPKPRENGLRMPSGNEAGANELWLPGGNLSTGQAEGVLNRIPKGSYIEGGIK